MREGDPGPFEQVSIFQDGGETSPPLRTLPGVFAEGVAIQRLQLGDNPILQALKVGLDGHEVDG